MLPDFINNPSLASLTLNASAADLQSLASCSNTRHKYHPEESQRNSKFGLDPISFCLNCCQCDTLGRNMASLSGGPVGEHVATFVPLLNLKGR